MPLLKFQAELLTCPTLFDKEFASHFLPVTADTAVASNSMLIIPVHCNVRTMCQVEFVEGQGYRVECLDFTPNKSCKEALKGFYGHR